MSGLFGQSNAGVAGIATAVAPSFTKGNAPGTPAGPADGQFTPAPAPMALVNRQRDAALARAGRGGTIAGRGQPQAVGTAYANRTLGGGG